MIRKSGQNSVSPHFGTPEPDKHIFNGELVLQFCNYATADTPAFSRGIFLTRNRLPFPMQKKTEFTLAKFPNRIIFLVLTNFV